MSLFNIILKSKLIRIKRNIRINRIINIKKDEAKKKISELKFIKFVCIQRNCILPHLN
jgi:hypothetical protein